MDALQCLQAFDAQRRAAGATLRRDGAGLPVEVREGASLCAYAWDQGELASITEPDGSRWDYRYGDDGRLLAVDRDGRPWARYAYDAHGRLTAADRADGRRAWDYDAQGRLERVRRGDAGPWAYRWQDGRVSEAYCEHEHSAFTYDAAGRLTGLVQRVAGVALAVSFRFDGEGRLSAVEFPDWGQRIDYGWDARGRAASVGWNGRELMRLGSDDDRRLAWSEGIDGVRAQAWHERASGRACAVEFSRGGAPLWRADLERDEAFRLRREGSRRHTYDAQGRLVGAEDGDRCWRYHYDAAENVRAEGDDFEVECDALGRVRRVRDAASERVYRWGEDGDLESLLVNGECVARCRYDHKGRLVVKQGPDGTGERYLYGADDALLAVADLDGRPRLLVLRLPTGIVALIDFRRDAAGAVVRLHLDAGGNLVLAGDARGRIEGPFEYDPFGVPLQPDGSVPALYRGRMWHAEAGLYRLGGRWYDPRLRRFLTPDSHTGAPDDARLVSPFVPAAAQRMARARLLADWLREPRLRCRFAYCANDPVNRFDPDGHWSFGGVLLSLLGVLWTLPNTAFGLAVEVSCLVGEVVRWLAWVFTAGHATWQTPGFDVAASGRLNAFALVFKGGWLGSFRNLLGITFGNVFFVNGEYQDHEAWKALPAEVAPPAYGGEVKIPKEQVLYEHELRHVQQYGWLGPFFHLGLPLFGVYEWDVILHGYQEAALERDAREHAGF
ncbi:RHS repeat domain-containing protein [Azohydromonas aeria]|uniref:RHS repeat domain-containing protein n=1 Tax=Azohydromonas aeria TaxID=2590212 RepID=UPI0012FB5472|nr:RHS repeat-associated core domain-containing protein [Azohydromonas aeria]